MPRSLTCSLPNFTWPCTLLYGGVGGSCGTSAVRDRRAVNSEPRTNTAIAKPVSWVLVVASSAWLHTLWGRSRCLLIQASWEKGSGVPRSLPVLLFALKPRQGSVIFNVLVSEQGTEEEKRVVGKKGKGARPPSVTNAQQVDERQWSRTSGGVPLSCDDVRMVSNLMFYAQSTSTVISGRERRMRELSVRMAPLSLDSHFLLSLPASWFGRFRWASNKHSQ